MPLILLLLFAPASRVQAGVPAGHPTILLVIGAPGEPAYATNFLRQVQLWMETCQRASAQTKTIGTDEATAPSDRDRLQQLLEAEPRDHTDPLWVVLIGHGTFDGREARFNLRGPDLSANELAAWLKPFRRPLVILNTASASAPFLNALSGTNRVIVTATRSGQEVNFTRLGQHLAEAFATPQGDLDQDGQTSLLEAFLSASARVAEFYQSEGRLATEHALIDDNGDDKGTPADWFRGVRTIKQAQDGAADGRRAHQIHLLLSPAEQALAPETRARRDELELAIAGLRERKPAQDEQAYYRELEVLLLELARLYSTAGSP